MLGSGSQPDVPALASILLASILQEGPRAEPASEACIA